MDKKKIGNVSLFTIVIGAILLGVFRIIYPNTSPTEVLTVVVIISLAAAVVLNEVLSRWRARRKKDASPQ